MIAVTFALPAESSDFVHRLERSVRNPNDGLQIRGHLHQKPITVFHTGVGEKSCRARIEKLLQEQQQLQYLISAGFAGALNDELKVGDLFLARNFTTPELQAMLHLTEEEFVSGKLLTSRTIIEEKAARFRLATDSGALAVDMETEFIAAACRVHGVPMLSLRVMSDTSSAPLPAPAKTLFNIERQTPAFGRLAFYLATHPGRIREVAAFRRRVALARARLAGALAAVIGHI